MGGPNYCPNPCDVGPHLGRFDILPLARSTLLFFVSLADRGLEIQDVEPTDDLRILARRLLKQLKPNSLQLDIRLKQAGTIPVTEATQHLAAFSHKRKTQ